MNNDEQKKLDKELLDRIVEDSMRPDCIGINRVNACRILRERYGFSLAQANEYTRKFHSIVYEMKFGKKETN